MSIYSFLQEVHHSDNGHVANPIAAQQLSTFSLNDLCADAEWAVSRLNEISRDKQERGLHWHDIHFYFGNMELSRLDSLMADLGFFSPDYGYDPVTIQAFMSGPMMSSNGTLHTPRLGASRTIIGLAAFGSVAYVSNAVFSIIGSFTGLGTFSLYYMYTFAHTISGEKPLELKIIQFPFIDVGNPFDSLATEILDRTHDVREKYLSYRIAQR